MAEIHLFEDRQEQLREFVDRLEREDVSIRVTPEIARALWSAVWALEESMSVLHAIQQMPSPPPYADSVVQQRTGDLALLRDVLHR